MFSALRLGLAVRLARAPVPVVFTRLTTPTSILAARRTFLTSARVSEPAAAAKAKPKTTKAKSKTTSKTAAKTTVKKATAAKKPAKKAAAKKPAKKKVAKRKPKKVAPPKIDRQLIKPPAKPTSAYILWTQEQPKHKITSLAEAQERLRALGAEWQTIPQHVKEEYHQRYLQQRSAWEKQYEEWYNSLTPEQMKAAQARKKKSSGFRLSKPHGQPARPPSAYILFYLEFKRDNSGLPVQEATKQAGKVWAEASEATKERYREQFGAAYAQYRKDLEAYKQRFATP
ncbi:hypothetical protein V5O48_000612 [Marasmius crinis-equi]|uniref:HMG box domain-containing protein n=1 Tax=Marasmius crinis-equi TaxID=585013 RepID=A0ABR3G1C1_9AGAR